MNAAVVSRTLSLIPERIARAQSGSAFTADEAAKSHHPDRVAHVMQFLGWMSPLNPLTKDDLRILGLLNPYGKPVGSTQAAGEDLDEEDEEMADEETLTSEEDLEPLAPSFAEATLPPPAPAAP
jgi:hypothetical protein